MFILLGRFGLRKSTNLAEINPLWLAGLIFILPAQAKTTSSSHFVSSHSLGKIPVKNSLWRLHKPFFHLMYEAVVIILILNFSHISLKASSMNSTQLSLNTYLWAPSKLNIFGLSFAMYEQLFLSSRTFCLVTKGVFLTLHLRL